MCIRIPENVMMMQKVKEIILIGHVNIQALEQLL